MRVRGPGNRSVIITLTPVVAVIVTVAFVSFELQRRGNEVTAVFYPANYDLAQAVVALPQWRHGRGGAVAW
jgi:hypothetical protein